MEDQRYRLIVCGWSQHKVYHFLVTSQERISGNDEIFLPYGTHIYSNSPNSLKVNQVGIQSG